MPRTMTFEVPDQICVSCKKLGAASVRRMESEPGKLGQLYVGVPQGWVYLHVDQNAFRYDYKGPRKTGFTICKDCYLMSQPTESYTTEVSSGNGSAVNWDALEEALEQVQQKELIKKEWRR